MNNNGFRLIWTLLVLIAYLLQSACWWSRPSGSASATSSAPPPQSEISNIQVWPATAALGRSWTEDFPLPNCGSSGGASQTLASQTSVKRNISVGATASISGGGEVGISAAAKVKLEAAVELTYQQAYESANSRLDSITINAAPWSHVIYQVLWEEQIYNSVITYNAQSMTHQAPYSYIIQTPKLNGTFQVECPTPVPPTPDIQATAQAYEAELANFAPPSLSGGVIAATLRGSDFINFETGRLSGVQDPGVQWDLRFICGAEMREVLRALDGASWFDRGVTNFDTLTYREIRDANYISQVHPQTGYTDLYYAHISNVPGSGYVFYIRTPEGNVVKLQILDYVMYDNNPYICRDMQVRYEVFPIVADPPRPGIP